MTKTGREWLRLFLATALSIGVLVVAFSARAAGRVEWKTKTLKESDSHSWTIDVAIYLSKAPDVNTLPMRFSFEPVVYYERALLDGKDGPQERKVPLEGKPPLVESVDVGFMDPGTGKVEKRTKFTFKVTRGHGFEAGEYDVTIRDGRTDAPMGSPTHLIFEGENEIVDRRAVVFSGEKKKDAKDADSDEKKNDDAPQKKELTPDDPGYWEGGPKNTEKQEQVEPKSGCGCRVGAHGEHDALLAFGALGLLMLAQRRRRRV
ncbi:MAG TPA: MYXO-CTERM sorting domain-containing protein [Polyangiaceae bacterium]|nr:MYXO-CTERM sorting domain-containing protein [Polyangiaceae bacterium]